MSAPNLHQAVETITSEAVNAVAKRRGSAMRFKVGRAYSDSTEYRVPVFPIRPVARLAAFYELFAEAEEEVQQHYPGLRVAIVPEKSPKRQSVKRAGVRKSAKGRAASTESKGT